MLRMLMEAAVGGLLGAERQERSSVRSNYRHRTLDTRAGALQLRLRKLRLGSDVSPFLEPGKALVVVIQEA